MEQTDDISNASSNANSNANANAMQTEASNNTFELPTKRASLILLLGKQGSGKTHFLKSLLRDGFKAGHFKFGRVYVRTKFNKDFDFMPEKSVHQDFSLDKIQTYCNKLAKWREENEGKMVPANVLVLDDMLGLLKSNDRRWINLLANLRHYGMTIIVTSQYFAAGGVLHHTDEKPVRHSPHVGMQVCSIAQSILGSIRHLLPEARGVRTRVG